MLVGGSSNIFPSITRQSIGLESDDDALPPLRQPFLPHPASFLPVDYLLLVP